MPAGRYVVEASLPSGQILSEDVEVTDGRATEVRLGVTGSPHESHTLQYVMGNIESGSVYYAPGVYVVPHSRSSRSYEPGWDEASADIPGEPDDLPAGNPVDAPADGPPPTLPTPLPPPAQVVLLNGGSGTPPSIADLAALGDSGDEIGDLMGAAAPLSLAPASGDAVAPLYRFAEPGAPPTDPASPGRLYHYLHVDTGVQDHLVTLPWPWVGPTGEPVVVEVLVNLRQSPTGSAVSVAVRDPLVGGGLGYLAAGALDRASVMFADAESMLYGKVSNPLAAAAGGYVLVGTQNTGEAQRWDPWLRNLRDWFPQMADGAVVLGTRMLRTASNDADAAAAREVLLEGFTRGLPVYSLGLSWLLDGLSAFPDDPASAEAVQQVRRLTWRVDLREPFTVIRLGGQRDRTNDVPSP